MSNKIYLHGRLTADPELKNTQSGVSLCNFTVACDRNYTKQGEDKSSDFFNVTAWRGLAEVISKNFTKGKEIVVFGEMQSRKYTDDNGVTRIIWDVSAENIEFCGSKGSIQQTNQDFPYQASQEMQEASNDDDLPF